MTANKTFLLRPDTNIVIIEIISPAVKTNGENIKVRSMRSSARIIELILILIKDIITRHIKTSIQT